MHGVGFGRYEPILLEIQIWTASFVRVEFVQKADASILIFII